jgi:hypothetical protein
MTIKYQAEPLSSVKNPCVLGEIPGLKSAQKASGQFEFSCESKSKLLSDEFRMIFLLMGIVVAGSVILHCFGIIDFKVVFGIYQKEDDLRFAKIKEDLHASAEGDSIRENEIAPDDFGMSAESGD